MSVLLKTCSENVAKATSSMVSEHRGKSVSSKPQSDCCQFHTKLTSSQQHFHMTLRPPVVQYSPPKPAFIGIVAQANRQIPAANYYFC